MPARKVASAPLEGRNARMLIRQLAEGRRTISDLSRQYGVTPSAVSQFAKRHAEEIEKLKADANAAMDDLWIANKAERIREYQKDADIADELTGMAQQVARRAAGRAEAEQEAGDPDVLAQAAEDRLAALALADVPKLQASKHRAVRAVAEELGQLPNKSQVEITGETTVHYQVVGVSAEELDKL